jgi:cell division protein FtsW
MVNMAVNVNIFPTTGVTLPLISMGGSSLLFTCFSIGIILSVARNVEQAEGRAVRLAAKQEEENQLKNKEEAENGD